MEVGGTVHWTPEPTVATPPLSNLRSRCSRLTKLNTDNVDTLISVISVD